MTSTSAASLRAAAKSQVDRQIQANGGVVDADNESYLKALISRGKQTVSDRAAGIQFFIIRGGSGGPSRVVMGGGSTTAGQPGSGATMMVFDESDLLAAFDAKGKLISSASLSRPLLIRNPDIWTEKTADKVYGAWNGRPVSIYYNKNFDVKYYGLTVDDSLGYYRSGLVRIDLHKKEATNGCIFILDPSTPIYSEDHPEILSAFEPKFIKDIQIAIGARTKPNIGIMHMVDLAP